MLETVEASNTASMGTALPAPAGGTAPPASKNPRPRPPPRMLLMSPNRRMSRGENCRCERAVSASRMPLLGAAAVGDAWGVFTAVSRDSVADEWGPFTWVERRCDNEIVHSSPSCERGCPKRGRNALPRAGFTLEKCLIFPGGAAPAPISHAVPRVSGSKVRYSTAAGEDCYSLFSGAIQPGSQMENVCRASCHTCTH